MSLLHFRLFIQLILLWITIFRLWYVMYPHSAETVAYKLCFAALPSYTYCKSSLCFQSQAAVSHFALRHMFSEHLEMCKRFTEYEYYMLKNRGHKSTSAHLEVWQSFLRCVDHYSDTDADSEDFPFHSTCKPIYDEVMKKGDYLYYAGPMYSSAAI
jgi:hypothetical protein